MKSLKTEYDDAKFHLSTSFLWVCFVLGCLASGMTAIVFIVVKWIF